MAEKIELLIFDMDGLMIDTERLSQRCWRRVAKKYGYELPQRIFNLISGMDNRKIPLVYKAELGSDFPFDEIKAEVSVIAKQYIETYGVPAKAGLRECLEVVKGLGLRCAVASSTPHARVCEYLTKLGVIDYFELIQSGEDIPRGKPNPDVFLLVCKKTKVDTAHAVVLEDSNNGLKAAAAAGIRSIWIPDVVVVEKSVKKTIWRQGNSLAEVPDMVREISQ